MRKTVHVVEHVKQVARVARDHMPSFRFLIFALFLSLQGLILASANAAAASMTASGFSVSGDSKQTEVTVRFNAEPNLKWLMLRDPYRLSIELPATRFAFDPEALRMKAMMREVTYGATGDNAARITLTMKGPFAVNSFDTLPQGNGRGFLLRIKLGASTSKQFETALREQALTTSATGGGSVAGMTAGQTAKPFTIVIDPGHGGLDGGAQGVSGAAEKDITLAFAQELKKYLEAKGGFVIHLTRSSDVFLRLDERVHIARSQQADLFISIHADSINLKGVRGATVYTVSDQASDAEAQALADRENLSDQLTGIEAADQNHEVADILVDLIRRETHGFSLRFARGLVGKLSETTGMINNPHRFAGFRVLKAPDVPSVLVELGYLSNLKDEEQLRDPRWRQRMVTSIASAVAEFAAQRVASGG